jgi:hypothetical protein
MTKLWVVLAGVVVVVAGTAQAQSAWEGKWKTVNGTCGEGLVVKVTEKPGVLEMKFMGAPQIPPADRNVTLAADGSGKFGYRSDIFGDLEILVPAGSGKREVRLHQVKGVCRWVLSAARTERTTISLLRLEYDKVQH